MKRAFIYIILPLFCCLSCQKSQDLSYQDFTLNFYEAKDSLERLSYTVRRVDSFADGNVWDNTGFAHLERAQEDTIFGFNFYAKRDDVPQISIYDKGNNFDMDMEEMVYEISPGAYYFVGSPGGQMVSSSFFKLDENYESASVAKLDSGYEVRYTYPDDSLYMVTNRRKILKLDESFLPRTVSVFSLNQGEKTSSSFSFSNIRINDKVDGRIETYKELIQDYTLLEPETYVPSDYLGQPLPAMELTNIQTGETSLYNTDKLLLIDFWEVWCGWCIKSFPEVEKLQQKYAEDLTVIGIATESKDKALELIAKKGITFSNYYQDQAFLDKFNIKSWPTYILVDQQGIMVKEYFGFKEAIETDIKALINEKL
jgi:thiol-disulfide isomerase/thioredoxin